MRRQADGYVTKIQPAIRSQLWPRFESGYLRTVIICVFRICRLLEAKRSGLRLERTTRLSEKGTHITGMLSETATVSDNIPVIIGVMIWESDPLL
jgi:hypothetical protein